MNKVVLVGALGKDVEVKSTQGGKKYGILNLATSEKYKDKSGQWTTQTQWHKVVYWSIPDGLVSWLTKGSIVSIDGSIKYDQYEKDGVKMTSTSIICAKLNLIKAGKNDSSQQNNSVHEDNDIPF